MGTPKAELSWQGESLAERAARVLTAVCDPVVEVGPGYTGLPSTLEDPPGEGPLAAFVAGAEALSRAGRVPEPVMLLAVDLPFVDSELIELVARWPGERTAVPVADGHRQVLCARYGTEAPSAAARLLADGRRSLVALLDHVAADFLPEAAWRAVAPAHVFADVDTPEDLTRWRRDVHG
jgi:molybdopterin-guanine dinucleotide biosynthesis protein A